MNNGKKGFTLVEMLIVIAVIGILAVAVLSAINPIEQIRKGQDTRRRSNAAELLNAIERYYTTYEENPPTLTDGAADTLGCGDITTTGLVESGELDDLSAANELKTEFEARILNSDNYVYAGFDEVSGLASVCYMIKSNANIQLYSGASNSCINGTDRYVCLPE